MGIVVSKCFGDLRVGDAFQVAGGERWYRVLGVRTDAVDVERDAWVVRATTVMVDSWEGEITEGNGVPVACVPAGTEGPWGRCPDCGETRRLFRGGQSTVCAECLASYSDGGVL